MTTNTLPNRGGRPRTISLSPMASLMRKRSVGALALLALMTPTAALVAVPALSRPSLSKPFVSASVDHPPAPTLAQHSYARDAQWRAPARGLDAVVLLACRFLCAQTGSNPKIRTLRSLVHLRGGASGSTAVLSADFVLTTLAPLLVSMRRLPMSAACTTGTQITEAARSHARVASSRRPCSRLHFPL